MRLNGAEIIRFGGGESVCQSAPIVGLTYFRQTRYATEGGFFLPTDKKSGLRSCISINALNVLGKKLPL